MYTHTCTHDEHPVLGPNSIVLSHPNAPDYVTATATTDDQTHRPTKARAMK